jgi:hypothetical protein
VTVAVLPHAIRILERDSGAEGEKVRESAVKGLAELEGIIHSRLPPQKGPGVSNPQSQGEEQMVEVDEDSPDEETDEMVVEETVVEQDVPNGNEKSESESAPAASNGLETNVTKPSLPSFVAPAEPTLPRSQGTSSSSSSGKSASDAISMAVASKDVNRGVKDVYSTGAWKNVQTGENDEDEEMPEIDMGFDSDEE